MNAIIDIFNIFILIKELGTHYNATDLGQMVSSLSADNELWLAMVLQHETMRTLEPNEFAAVIGFFIISFHTMTISYHSTS